MSLAEGMISRLRVLHPSESGPFLHIMGTVWGKFRALKLVAADALHAELKMLLETEMQGPATQLPSCAMPAEADAVGPRDMRLRDFLLSPTQTEITFNLSKAG